MSNFYMHCGKCGHNKVFTSRHTFTIVCPKCDEVGNWLEGELLPMPKDENVEFTIPDSGAKRTFPSGAWRDNADGKGRYDLLPPAGIFAVAKRFEDGAKKYGDNNWQKGSGMPMEVFYDSAMRHLFKAMAGQTDEDHLAAAAWNILCAIETRDVLSKKKRKSGEDMTVEEFEAVCKDWKCSSCGAVVIYSVSQRKIWCDNEQCAQNQIKFTP